MLLLLHQSWCIFPGKKRKKNQQNHSQAWELVFWSQNVCFGMCHKTFLVSRHLWEQLLPQAQNCFSSLISYCEKEIWERYGESLENPWYPIKLVFHFSWLKNFISQQGAFLLLSLFYIISLIVGISPVNWSNSQDHSYLENPCAFRDGQLGEMSLIQFSCPPEAFSLIKHAAPTKRATTYSRWMIFQVIFSFDINRVHRKPEMGYWV